MSPTPTPEANTLVSGARNLLDIGRRVIPNRGPGERAAPTREPTPAPPKTAPTPAPGLMPSGEMPGRIVAEATGWPLWYAFLLLLLLLLLALALFFLLRRRRRNRQPARRYY